MGGTTAAESAYSQCGPLDLLDLPPSTLCHMATHAACLDTFSSLVSSCRTFRKLLLSAPVTASWLLTCKRDCALLAAVVHGWWQVVEHIGKDYPDVWAEQGFAALMVALRASLHASQRSGNGRNTDKKNTKNSTCGLQPTGVIRIVVNAGQVIVPAAPLPVIADADAAADGMGVLPVASAAAGGSNRSRNSCGTSANSCSGRSSKVSVLDPATSSDEDVIGDGLDVDGMRMLQVLLRLGAHLQPAPTAAQLELLFPTAAGEDSGSGSGAGGSGTQPLQPAAPPLVPAGPGGQQQQQPAQPAQAGLQQYQQPADHLQQPQPQHIFVGQQPVAVQQGQPAVAEQQQGQGQRRGSAPAPGGDAPSVPSKEQLLVLLLRRSSDAAVATLVCTPGVVDAALFSQLLTTMALAGEAPRLQLLLSLRPAAAVPRLLMNAAAYGRAAAMRVLLRHFAEQQEVRMQHASAGAAASGSGANAATASSSSSASAVVGNVRSNASSSSNSSSISGNAGAVIGNVLNAADGGSGDLSWDWQFGWGWGWDELHAQHSAALARAVAAGYVGVVAEMQRSPLPPAPQV